MKLNRLILILFALVLILLQIVIAGIPYSPRSGPKSKQFLSFLVYIIRESCLSLESVAREISCMDPDILHFLSIFHGTAFIYKIKLSVSTDNSLKIISIFLTHSARLERRAKIASHPRRWFLRWPFGHGDAKYD